MSTREQRDARAVEKMEIFENIIIPRRSPAENRSRCLDAADPEDQVAELMAEVGGEEDPVQALAAAYYRLQVEAMDAGEERLCTAIQTARLNTRASEALRDARHRLREARQLSRERLDVLHALADRYPDNRQLRVAVQIIAGDVPDTGPGTVTSDTSSTDTEEGGMAPTAMTYGGMTMKRTGQIFTGSVSPDPSAPDATPVDVRAEQGNSVVALVPPDDRRYQLSVVEAEILSAQLREAAADAPVTVGSVPPADAAACLVEYPTVTRVSGDAAVVLELPDRRGVPMGPRAAAALAGILDRAARMARRAQ
jgi:hypothetical protein